MAATDSRVINFLVVRQDNSPFGACEDQYCEEKGQEGERERHADKQLIIIITCLSVNRTCLMVCWLCILGLEDQFTCSLSNYVDLNQTRQVFPLIQLLWDTFSVWFNATCADSRGKSQGRCSENLIQEQLQNSSGKVKNSETCPSHTIHLELISISIGCVMSLIENGNWMSNNINEETRPVISQFRTWHMTRKVTHPNFRNSQPNHSCNSFSAAAASATSLNASINMHLWSDTTYHLSCNQSAIRSIDPRPFTLTKLL